MDKRRDEILDGTGSINFEWVQHTSVPGTASSSQTRKQVRSHITRLQHRRARAGLQYKDRKPYSKGKPSKKARERSKTPPAERAVTRDNETAVKPAAGENGTHGGGQLDNEEVDGGWVTSRTNLVPVHDQELPYSSDSSVSSLSSQSLSDYFTVIGGRADPFHTCPIEYHAVHDKLLHHMLTVFAPRGWPVMNISTAEGLSWERFMTQKALAEPALFLVRLLFATGDLIRLDQLDPRVADWLRSLAVNEINAALSDPSRYISDGLVLAVGRIALGELLYGDREAAINIHRPAWKKMIEMRGGMKALPFPALVKKLMRWSDSVMALKSNTKTLLEGPGEGEQTFSTAESVGVLRHWAPLEEKPRPRNSHGQQQS